MPKYDAIPQQLKAQARFCCWRYEERDGKTTKVPYNAMTGGKAQTNVPETFCDYTAAVERVAHYDGLGFRVADGICALDLDKCFEGDGSLKAWAQDVACQFSGCYMEKSPSGTGLRIIFMAPDFAFDKAQYYINNRNLGFEVYVAGATNRFVTLTGNVYREGDLLDMTEPLQQVLDRYMRRAINWVYTEPSKAKSYLTDESVLKKALKSSSGDKLKRLWSGDDSGYGSASEADLALASILAFWCGNDLAQMDRIFRQSGLMRDKWDRAQSGSTYGRVTLAKACQLTRQTYSPIGKKSLPEEDFAIEESINLESMKPNDNPRYSWSDIGNGNLFADFYQDQARYAPERKLWYIFDRMVWKPDIGSIRTMELCKLLADKLMVYTLSIENELKRNEYINFVRHWQSRRYRETILKDAAGLYPIYMAALDSDPYVFNCLNGTLNLKTGEFYRHRAGDMLSKVSGVIYDPSARCERWDLFIQEVMEGDMEKARFLQKALGYALTGDSRLEALFVLHGSKTRNGKSTCMETMMRIMGDYGKTARPETIGMKFNNSSNNPTEDIARLAGARLVNISEPDKRLTLSSALVKTLTGNDTINARFLHENSFDYRPQFKLFINTNHLPQVNDLTLFTSGRVKIIPFERHFEPHEQDQRLKSTLTKPQNLSGILNWCIDGYRLMEAEGLEMPESVSQATESYQHSSDKIALFMEDALTEDHGCEVRTAEVYAVYKRWCSDNGLKAESSRNFNAALSAITPIERRRPRNGGEKTTLINGFQLLSSLEFLA